MQLTQSQEDYLETIYNEVLKSGCAKVTDIALLLDVKKGSVSEAINILSKKGLINYEPYSAITMTDLGVTVAKKILQRHEFMSEFFVNILELSKEEATIDACKMEHIMSEKLFEKFTLFCNFINEYSNVNADFKKELKKIIK